MHCLQLAAAYCSTCSCSSLHDQTLQVSDLNVLPCRYVYMACAVRPTNIGNGLAKMDVTSGEVHTWHEPGGIVGECLLGIAVATGSWYCHGGGLGWQIGWVLQVAEHSCSWDGLGGRRLLYRVANRPV
jgi:hypothetical protein